MQYLLLFTIFVVSTCGLIYELVAGTIASYLLGDSVMQFSTVIGVYLFSMGVGSFLSKYFRDNLLKAFIQIEILTGLIGGFSSCILFLTFGYVDSFRIVLYSLVFITGTLVGLEIPLIMRILRSKIEFKDLVSQVFTFDYIGALLASLLFPLLMVPYLGLVRTSIFFGIMNAGLAIYLCFYFKAELKRHPLLPLQGIAVLAALIVGFVFSNEITSFSEQQLFSEKIIFSKSSPYQRIVLTRKKDDLRLYLNNNLQFSSSDEYRYHEALVHPAMCLTSSPRSVLILGGGDGLAAREVFKYPTIDSVTLVDLDRDLTDLFRKNTLLREISDSSLTDSRMRLVNADAFEWIRGVKEKFDVVIIDFPDPATYSVGKLYTQTFYRLVANVMHDSSIAVVQSTSPLVAPRSFWCVNNTIGSAHFRTIPYHVYVPSFGEWGFILFSMRELPAPVFSRLPDHLQFFSEHEFAQMRHFPKDMVREVAAVQRLDNQVLVEYFEEEWSGY